MSIPAVPKSKILGFIFLGIILFLGSSYLDALEAGFGPLGVYTGLALILIGVAAQLISWRPFLTKRWKGQF